MSAAAQGVSRPSFCAIKGENKQQGLICSLARRPQPCSGVEPWSQNRSLSPGEVYGPEGVLKVGRSRAEQDELDALVHEPAEGVADQVDALLVVQPPDEAQQRHVRVLRQAQLLPKVFIMIIATIR